MQFYPAIVEISVRLYSRDFGHIKKKMQWIFKNSSKDLKGKENHKRTESEYKYKVEKPDERWKN